MTQSIHYIILKPKTAQNSILNTTTSTSTTTSTTTTTTTSTNNNNNNKMGLRT